MKEKCHLFALPHTDVRTGGGTQQSFIQGGPTPRFKPIPCFIKLNLFTKTTLGTEESGHYREVAVLRG